MDIIVQVKNCIKAAIYQVKANISVYSRHSGIDFIRKRKLTLPVLIRFFIQQEVYAKLLMYNACTVVKD